ncbi:MAG TPA: hypothetical protein PL072_05760 [Phycisphaerales bacterium]|nr:hypothetical protein [Phycisphaerales bacterium]
MSLSFMLVIALGIIVLGSIVAVLWWNLARQAAPYRDELEREQKRADRSRDEESHNVVVIDGPPGATGRPPGPGEPSRP